MKIREKDFLRAVRRADPRYFSEVRERMADAALRKGKRLMKQQEKKHIVRKIAIGALIAAATLGGGYAAMVALRNNQGIFGEESRDIRSMAEEQSSKGRTEQSEQTLHLNLTDQYWYPAMQTSELGNDYYYTQSDTGWYHSCRISLQASDGDPNTDAFGRAVQDYDKKHPNQIAKANKPVCYLDSESGEDVILCAKPDCLHDGNEYCEATTTAYTHGNLLWHEGVLYAAAQKHNGKDEAVLLSYDPAGSGITELAQFGPDNAEPVNDILIHRGYVWCMFKVKETIAESVDIIGRTIEKNRSGYVIMGYEIATGQTVELYRSMPPEGQVYEYEIPTQFTACGDYLFYRVQFGLWPSQNYKGIFSVNLRTGEHKKVESVGETGYETAYTATENAVIWCCGDGQTAPCKFVKTDLATGERTDFYDGWFTMLSYDGERFYGVQQVIDKDVPHNEIVVLNKDGTELGRYRMEDRRGITGMQVRGGTLYLLKYGKLFWVGRGVAVTETLDSYEALPWDGVLISCRIDDLIAGTPQFSEVLKVTNRIILDVEPFR